MTAATLKFARQRTAPGVMAASSLYWFAFALLAIGCALCHGAEPVLIEVDLASTQGEFRALNGINKGPLAAGGIADVSNAQRALQIPWTRLHDCHWPNPDVVDIHAVFPNPEADPAVEGSYSFARTDEYLAAAINTGSGLIYRLGESIEHDTIKRYVHPPKDPARWAQICLGIISHYNEGWAGGFHYNIPYWEIWNEPENRPVMWTGSDSDYFALYRVASRAIKERYPKLKVGGPAIGGTGSLENGQFHPSPFLNTFLETCRREALPLDFFSWHCYSDKPAEFAIRARAIRALLDSYGFNKTESHLNEWNYLPDNSWSSFSRKSSGEDRQRTADRMAGPEGAAFIIASLLKLQDAPVDVCNFFHGEAGAFGLFSEQGARAKVYHAFSAFNSLMRTPKRIQINSKNSPELPVHIAAGPGINSTRSAATILISDRSYLPNEIHLDLLHMPWNGQSSIEVQILDATHALDKVQDFTADAGPVHVWIEMAPPAVVLINVKPVSK